MMRAWMWCLIDTGWFLLSVACTIAVAVAITATPIWLGIIHRDLVAIRYEVRPCECRHCDEDGPGPVLPRVLPRVRNLREEAGE